MSLADEAVAAWRQVLDDYEVEQGAVEDGLRAERDQARDELEVCRVQHDTDVALIEQLRARVAELEAQLPDEDTMLVGASVRGNLWSDATMKASLWPKVQATRVFLDNIPTSWPGHEFISRSDGRPMVVSANEHDPAKLQAWLNMRPEGQVIYWVCDIHEPNANGKRTAADHLRRAGEDAPVVIEAGCQPIQVFTRYLMDDPAFRATWRVDWVLDRVDVWTCWDAYNGGAKQTPPTYRSVASILDPIAAYAEETGKPTGIAEFGSSPIGTPEQRAAWYREYLDACAAHGFKFCLLWEGPTGEAFNLDPVTAEASLGGLPARP